MSKKLANDKCPSCGGTFVFNPKNQNLTCKKCGSEVEIEFSKNVLKHDISEIRNSKLDQVWNKNNVVLKCNACGAKMLDNANTYSTTCPYCGSTNVVNHSEMVGLKPDSIIPFQFDETQAIQIFKENLKSKFFLPSKLKKGQFKPDVRSLYVPSFTFDAITTTEYSGWVYKWVESKEHGRQKKSYHISGTISINHTDVIVEVSDHIDSSQLNSILPFYLNKAVAFNEDFVRGFPLEQFNTLVDTAYNNAKNEINRSIKNAIISKHNADGDDNLTIQTSYSNEKYAYRVIPIYFMDYLYNKNKYSTIMNGQTGKVGKGFPRSISKILTAIFVPLGIVAGIAILCSIL